MAGEIRKDEGICLDIRPWSRTSHVVSWLTDAGRIATLVKGAVRPKSAFLGQYDLNYTCEILYYARSKSDLHILRECSPSEMRDALRDDFRALALGGYFRMLAQAFAPNGPECRSWKILLAEALDRLCSVERDLLVEMLVYELKTLELLGLRPDVEAESGSFALRGERRIPISPAVAAFLKNPRKNPSDRQVLLDSARVLGVFYSFHLDFPAEVRRSVLKMAVQNTKVTNK